MALRINLKNDINNTSLQIGDTAYYISNVTSMDKFGLGTNPGTSPEEINSPKPIGIITSIGGNFIKVETVVNPPSADDFIMFQKDRKVNNTYEKDDEDILKGKEISYIQERKEDFWGFEELDFTVARTDLLLAHISDKEANYIFKPPVEEIE